MGLPETVPTWQTPVGGEGWVQGIRNDEDVPPETRKVMMNGIARPMTTDTTADSIFCIAEPSMEAEWRGT